MSPKIYYKQLDGLRAIGILGIMYAHWYQPNSGNPWIQKIPIGQIILLFFVLSGFLITKIILNFKEKNLTKGINHSQSIKSFFIRRTLRIFPIYYLTLIVLYIVDLGEVRDHLPWFATYTTNFYMTIKGEYLDFGNHFWTLALEEQFYLVWVFAIVFIPTKYLRKAIIYSIIGSMLFLFKFPGLGLICLLHPFGLGALIAYYEQYENEFFNSISLFKIKMVLLALSVPFLWFFVFRPLDYFEGLNVYSYSEPWSCAIFTCVILIAVKNGFKGIFKWILENRVMIYIGRISYGLYIFHMFIPHLYWHNIYTRYRIEADWGTWSSIFFVLTMFFAIISWHILELPINKLKKHFKY